MKFTARVLIAFFVCLASVFAQGSITTTTLSAALAGGRNAPNVMYVASATSFFAPGVAESQGGVGSPLNPPVLTLALIDRELVRVNRINSTTISIERGWGGTSAAGHASGATVYVGPASYFPQADPVGTCTAGTLAVLPYLSYRSGTIWTCPASGPNASVWTKSGTADTFTFTDGEVFISPAACAITPTTTAFATGSPAMIVAAAGNPVLRATSDTTAGTFAVVCPIAIPTRLTATKGVTLTSVSLLYGVQTTNLASVAAATINSVVYPASTAAGAAATGTVVTTAGGTLTATPTTLQLTITTSGTCFNERITLGTPLSLSTDNKLITVAQTFTLAGTAATTLQICGVIARYTTIPL